MMLLLLLSCGGADAVEKADVDTNSIEEAAKDVEQARQDISCVKRYLIAQQHDSNIDFDEYEKKECE